MANCLWCGGIVIDSHIKRINIKKFCTFKCRDKFRNLIRTKEVFKLSPELREKRKHILENINIYK